MTKEYQRKSYDGANTTYLRLITDDEILAKNACLCPDSESLVEKLLQMHVEGKGRSAVPFDNLEDLATEVDTMWMEVQNM